MSTVDSATDQPKREVEFQHDGNAIAVTYRSSTPTVATMVLLFGLTFMVLSVVFACLAIGAHPADYLGMAALCVCIAVAHLVAARYYWKVATRLVLTPDEFRVEQFVGSKWRILATMSADVFEGLYEVRCSEVAAPSAPLNLAFLGDNMGEKRINTSGDLPGTQRQQIIDFFNEHVELRDRAISGT